KRVLFGFYLLGGWALDARLPAATSDGLVFELESRSILIDECVPCDRAPRELPLSGRFVLSPTGVDEAPFALTELALETAGGDYHVTGSGTYTRHSMLEGQPPSQEMSLAASINGREV